MEEIFKDIVGYENLYQISMSGKVKSLPRSWKIHHWQDKSEVIITSKERFLKPNISKRGYYKVVLCKDGQSQLKNIHRLVAETFLENPNNLKVINHKDGNKLNNNIKNLEWCSQKENMQHAFKTGLVKNNKPVRQYKINGEYVKTWKTMSEAMLFLKIYNIDLCCKRKRNYAGDYIWRYESDMNKIGKEQLDKEVKQQSEFILKKYKKFKRKEY